MPGSRKRKSEANENDEEITRPERASRSRKNTKLNSAKNDPVSAKEDVEVTKKGRSSAGIKRKTLSKDVKVNNGTTTRPAPAKRKSRANGNVKAEEDNVPPSDKTVRASKAKLTSKLAIPTLVKEESENASAALERIAQIVNPASSSSEDTSDEDGAGERTKNRRKEESITKLVASSDLDQGGEDDDDDDLFEEIDLSTKHGASSKFDAEEEAIEEKDLNLTLEKAERLQLAKTGKKKQSVRAVHERAFCHYMSTIAMVALGAWRNMWTNEIKLHKILRKYMKKHATNLDRELSALAQSKTPITQEFVEIMGRVMRYFDTQFKRTKPGLRKLGHRAVAHMDAATELESAAESFANKEEYLAQASKLEGSRDFGAQLFTALLRAYHFKARLVFSTQPLGFKFNEREEFNPSLVRDIVEGMKRRTNIASDNDTSHVAQSGPSTGMNDDAISLSESELSDVGSEFSVEADDSGDIGISHKMTVSKVKKEVVDEEIEYPIFWTEVYDFSQARWVAIDSMVKKVVLVDDKGFKSLHPRGAKAERQKLTLGFVVAYDANLYAKDVTMRYASSWAKVKEVFLRADGKTNTRYDVNKILVGLGNPHRDEDERREDDLLAFKEVKRPPPDEMPTNLADFKSSPKYILDKHLREKCAFKPGAKPVDTFTMGKGSKAITSEVFLREDVVPAKTIENYHKEGRRIKEGERPIKMIKARAVTTARLREHAAIMEETGEKHVMQGIYSIDQTEYIIPPPIKDGIIPKNAYGNADVFVESMIPKGATHLKLKGVSKIARKLEIEHAEAVVGFEFKARGAIPVVLGVLVPDEHAERLEAAWHEAEELRIRKEDKKRTDAALKLWIKLLKGVRIRHRINAEYGIPVQSEQEEDGVMYIAPPENRRALPTAHSKAIIENDNVQHKEEQGGGFLREDDG